MPRAAPGGKCTCRAESGLDHEAGHHLAALDLLGPAYVWKTEAFATGTLADGVLDRRPAPAGGGDPKLTYDQFGRLLRMIRARGIREIRGDLVLDRRPSPSPLPIPGRFDAQPMRPYNVAPDALLLNFKAVTLQLIPDPAVEDAERRFPSRRRPIST
jgi:D-alanyl-D-alanine carboxypeptidase/D-alanyl-D-alanine-endopeptidase (penicillin-binding protein 4)